MISVSATTYDANGTLILPCRVTNPYQGQRRGSVTATLDGGVSVYDTGYSVADQTLTATLKAPSKVQLVSLQYLVAIYGEVIACCETGAYRALLTFAVSKDTLSLSLRLLSRLDA
jgi:hypothetical protein